MDIIAKVNQKNSNRKNAGQFSLQNVHKPAYYPSIGYVRKLYFWFGRLSMGFG
jgi:hypothetical protein